MDPKWTKIGGIAAAIIVIALIVYAMSGPHNFNDCIADRMENANTDVAARLIFATCATEFGVR